MTRSLSTQQILSYEAWDCSLAGSLTKSYDNLSVNDMVRKAAVVNPDGTVLLQFLEPTAAQGTVIVNRQPVTLQREGDYLVATLPLKSGISRIDLYVDGRYELYPYLPITVFANHPCNFIDIVEEGSYFEENSFVRGSVSFHTVYNSVKKHNDRLLVYVPQEYHGHPERSYDVIFLQHGFGENELGWTNVEKVNTIMDQMIEKGEISAKIVVMANGLFFRREEEKICLEPQRFTEYLLNDVIPYIKSIYRITDKMHLAGLSMGSIQTSITVFENPGMFETMGLFSGFISDPLTHYSTHLTDERIEAYKNSGCRMFRCIGKEDRFLPIYRQEEDFIHAKGVDCVSREYEGDHESNVWRSAIIDYLRFIEENRK